MSSNDQEKDLIPIPTVPKQYYGLFGNIPDVDPNFFARSVWSIADRYGPIVKLDMLNRKVIFLSNYKLAKEVMDDDRFEKAVSGAQLELRPLIKDGLFTAFRNEQNWWTAHRILVPIFGPMNIRKMFDEQLDIASQLILKWDRMGPSHEIDCSDDFTRLAFDTISLCSFSYRANSFYSENPVDFATQMAECLKEAGIRASSTTLGKAIRISAQRKDEENRQAMFQLCDSFVNDRINNPQPDNKDLLNVMLNSSDPETGAKLDRENIRFQIMTFLIAGHETTSGTLSFLFHLFMRNPEKYHKAQQEVDEVLGANPINLRDVPKLKYIDACIKETLRVQGPISLSSRKPREAVNLGGKYNVQPDEVIIINLNGLHHDPEVWGEDHADFKPERMLDFSKIPKDAWHPFGIGMRACIGRSFAEQEMIVIVALILQRFQVEMADPSYVMSLKSTLTVKPDGFKIRVRPRPGKGGLANLGGSTPKPATELSETKKEAAAGDVHQDGKPLMVVFGTNAGTCQAYAEEIQSNASRFGYKATVSTMDAATEGLPTDRPVIIITPSYEGRPPPNAMKFVSWLETRGDDKDMLKGVKYTVFGAGNSEWAATFHRIPNLVNDLMSKHGAESIFPMGLCDVKSDPLGPFDEWLGKLWTSLRDQDGVSSAVKGNDLQISIKEAVEPKLLVGHEMATATVLENKQLAPATELGPEKRHMKVELPAGLSYVSGDYLAVLPYNQKETVQRVLRQFKLAREASIETSGTTKKFLQSSTPLSINALLSSRVELSAVVTQRQMDILIGATPASSADHKSLSGLRQSGTYESSILAKRTSALDLLEDHPDCQLSFAQYLDLLPPLTVRQYSISSSALASSGTEHAHTNGHAESRANAENSATRAENGQEAEILTATITYDVISAPAWSSTSSHGRNFYGVASTYLSSLQPGDILHATVRATNTNFHLPTNPATPILMIAAGTGVAPMHGFVQERAALQAAMKEANAPTKIGPALLYYGCRDPDVDYLYKEEWAQWEKDGVVSMRPAFSRAQPKDGTEGYKYVPDRMFAEKDEVRALFKNGAKIFVCGSTRLANSTADICKKIYIAGGEGRTEEQAEKWFESVREIRYVTDTFA